MEEVERLVLLRKKLAQLSFLRALGREAEGLEEVEREVKEIEEKLKAYGLPFTYLRDEEIKALEEELSKVPPEELAKALAVKQGPLWEKASKKAELVGRNIELRKELALLYKALAKTAEKEKALKALAKGKVEEPFQAPKEVALLLARLGVKAVWEDGSVKEGEPPKEVRRAYRGSVYWLPENLAEEFDALAKELDRVTLELQRLNALRQARPLSDEEEKAFAEAQRRLMELLSKLEAFSNFKL